MRLHNSDRSLHSNVALAGLIINSFAMLDMKHTLLGKHHYMLYYLFVAAQPRMLMTVDEEGKPLPVSVRVGQAVGHDGQCSPRYQSLDDYYSPRHHPDSEPSFL